MVEAARKSAFTIVQQTSSGFHTTCSDSSMRFPLIMFNYTKLKADIRLDPHQHQSQRSPFPLATSTVCSHFSFCYIQSFVQSLLKFIIPFLFYNLKMLCFYKYYLLHNVYICMTELRLYIWRTTSLMILLCNLSLTLLYWYISLLYFNRQCRWQHFYQHIVFSIVTVQKSTVWQWHAVK